MLTKTHILLSPLFVQVVLRGLDLKVLSLGRHVVSKHSLADGAFEIHWKDVMTFVIALRYLVVLKEGLQRWNDFQVG